MMINLLIAMMSNTYDVTQELEREPLRQVNYLFSHILKLKSNRLILMDKQWARQFLIIEQNIALKERLKQQKKYAHVWEFVVKILRFVGQNAHFL